MATCTVGDQAVGAVAALSLKENTSDIRALSIQENIHALEQRLRRDDTLRPGLRNDAPADLASANRNRVVKVECLAIHGEPIARVFEVRR